MEQESNRLKQSLIDRDPLSAEAYMDGKQPFIERVEKEALRWKASSSSTPR